MSRKSNLTGIIAIAFAFMGLYSCTAEEPKIYFEESHSFSGSVWHMNDIVTFNAEITDTEKDYNIILNLRNTTSYEYSNLYVLMSTTFPNGSLHKDTLHLVLAEPNGQWRGDVSGTMVENRILINQNVKLPIEGSYKFELEQAMDNLHLKEVANVGLRIQGATAE